MISYSTHNTRGVAHLVVPFSENILEFIKEVPSETLMGHIEGDGIVAVVVDIATEMKYRDEKYAEERQKDILEKIEDGTEEPTNHRKSSALSKNLSVRLAL